MSAPRRSRLPAYHFDEQELAAAVDAWGCNCGPSALAMMLALKPNDVRDHIPGFLGKGYTNFTMMKGALGSLGVPFHIGPRQFSQYGLCRIQWGGPWCEAPPQTPEEKFRDRHRSPNTPAVKVGKWGYRFSHWIGSMAINGQSMAMVFDVNGGWMPEARWRAEIVPLLTKLYPRADGRFYITHNLEIDLTPSGVCVFCKCTDEDCSGCIERTGRPCHWIDPAQTICSACQPETSRNA